MKPFKVQYRDLNGNVREILIYAYNSGQASKQVNEDYDCKTVHWVREV